MSKFKVEVPSFLKSVRYSLAGVNVLFVLTGILLLISGVVIMIQNLEYELLITNKFLSLPAFVIATGTIIIFTSLLGSYAAISENFYFIAGYVVLMGMILIFEISIAIVSSGQRNDAVTEIRRTMTSSIQEYSTKREVAKAWDEMQSEFECCGVGGVYDWSSSRIPVSCCHIDFGAVSPFECTISDAYGRGCASELGSWLAFNAHVLAAIALTATAIQILLTAAGGWLAWRSKFEEVELES